MTEKIRTERFCSAVFEMKGDMYAIALSILKNKEDAEETRFSKRSIRRMKGSTLCGLPKNSNRGF